MIDLFLNWLGNDVLIVPDYMTFTFACVASLIILLFLIDIIKFILYYVSGRG